MSDKSGTQVSVCQRLGALVDGRDDRVRPPPSRCALLIRPTAYMLSERVTAKELQIVMGHWCHLCNFRRETSAVHSRIWGYMRGWERGRSMLGIEPAIELVHGLFLPPLFEFDLRAAVDEVITCSDASETGGGACFTTKLRPRAVEPLLAELARGRALGRDRVGLVELFGGIGGARMAFERLGIDLALYASAETDALCRAVVRNRWPDVVELGAVEGIDQARVRELLRRAPHLELLFVVGGSPCQGVARTNVDARAWGDPRAQLVKEIPRVTALCREALPQLRVHEMVENVASMSEEDRERFSSLLGAVPVELCAGECSLVKRPRLYWCTWSLTATPEFTWEARSGGGQWRSIMSEGMAPRTMAGLG